MDCSKAFDVVKSFSLAITKCFVAPPAAVGYQLDLLEPTAVQLRLACQQLHCCRFQVSLNPSTSVAYRTAQLMRLPPT